MPDLTDRYCVFWEDQHTARILQHYSHPVGLRNGPPLAWLRLDPETQEVHVYAGAVEIRDRRWAATLDTIQDAVNFCHAARDLLRAAEDNADEIADDRRGYSRIMPALEWAPYEIYEVTWHYQRAQDGEAPPA